MFDIDRFLREEYSIVPKELETKLRIAFSIAGSNDRYESGDAFRDCYEIDNKYIYLFFGAVYANGNSSQIIYYLEETIKQLNLYKDCKKEHLLIALIKMANDRIEEISKYDIERKDQEDGITYFPRILGLLWLYYSHIIKEANLVQDVKDYPETSKYFFDFFQGPVTFKEKGFIKHHKAVSDDFEKDPSKSNCAFITKDNPVDLYNLVMSFMKAYDPNFKPKACYVATAVYGSYNCPQVWALRRYRDYYLDNKWWGRAFIKLYYKISPTLIRLFGSTPWFQNHYRKVLDRKVNLLMKKGYEDTPYSDKY